MALTLSIELADGTTEKLTVDLAGPIVIGRDPGCHVVLPSPDVSRRHLSIEAVAGGHFHVTDSSANGTLIGTQLVRQQLVQVPAFTPMRVGPYVVRPVPAAAPASPPQRPLPAAAPAPPPPPPASGVGSPSAARAPAPSKRSRRRSPGRGLSV